MPPWHIARGVGIQKFKDDPSLTDAEIATIVKWVDAGAPQGNPADMPPPVAVQGRQRVADLGTPDLVVKSTTHTGPGAADPTGGATTSSTPASPKTAGCRPSKPSPASATSRSCITLVGYLMQDDDDVGRRWPGAMAAPSGGSSSSSTPSARTATSSRRAPAGWSRPARRSASTCTITRSAKRRPTQSQIALVLLSEGLHAEVLPTSRRTPATTTISIFRPGRTTSAPTGTRA